MLYYGGNKVNRIEMNKTNIGEGINGPMHTTAHTEFTDNGFSRDSIEESLLYSKLRKVNIQYGEHIPVYSPVNKKYGSFRNCNSHSTTPHMKGADTIEQRMKASNVSLGDTDLVNAYFNSTQQDFFTNKGKGEREPTVQSADKTLAHNFNLGGTNNLFSTYTSGKLKKFNSPAAKKMQPNTDFVKLLKADHFNIGNEPLPSKTLNQNFFSE